MGIVGKRYDGQWLYVFAVIVMLLVYVCAESTQLTGGCPSPLALLKKPKHLGRLAAAIADHTHSYTSKYCTLSSTMCTRLQTQSKVMQQQT